MPIDTEGLTAAFPMHPKFSLGLGLYFLGRDCPAKQLVNANNGLARVRRPLKMDLFTVLVHVNDSSWAFAWHDDTSIARMMADPQVGDCRRERAGGLPKFR
jgi:hypothetical protein